MREMRGRYVLTIAILVSFALTGAAQRITRPDPTDPAHPLIRRRRLRSGYRRAVCPLA